MRRLGGSASWATPFRSIWIVLWGNPRSAHGLMRTHASGSDTEQERWHTGDGRHAALILAHLVRRGLGRSGRRAQGYRVAAMRVCNANLGQCVGHGGVARGLCASSTELQV